MGALGVSLIVASVVYLIAHPLGLLPQRYLLPWRELFVTVPRIEGPKDETNKRKPNEESRGQTPSIELEQNGKASGIELSNPAVQRRKEGDRAKDKDALAMPPPPPPPVIQPPTIKESEEADEEQTTPKAIPNQPIAAVPSLSLYNGSSPGATREPISGASLASPSAPSSSLMPPPPRPPPRLNQFPAANSAQRSRGPAPDRSLGGGGLAPPPTHSSKPSKPSRKVLLTPGHSPLDWARVSSDPTKALNGLEPGSPFIRVTPSMLKRQTGRKGKDAWMALNGKVYNISPYADFHPGGVPELMRGAARDGTKLFGEIHPWVNYETMLQSCLVGLLVEEPVEGQSQESEMDKMD